MYRSKLVGWQCNFVETILQTQCSGDKGDGWGVIGVTFAILRRKLYTVLTYCELFGLPHPCKATAVVRALPPKSCYCVPVEAMFLELIYGGAGIACW